MPKRRGAWSSWNYITRSTFSNSSSSRIIDQVCLYPSHFNQINFQNILDEQSSAYFRGRFRSSTSHFKSSIPSKTTSHKRNMGVHSPGGHCKSISFITLSNRSLWQRRHNWHQSILKLYRLSERGRLLGFMKTDSHQELEQPRTLAPNCRLISLIQDTRETLEYM